MRGSCLPRELVDWNDRGCFAIPYCVDESGYERKIQRRSLETRCVDDDNNVPSTTEPPELGVVPDQCELHTARDECDSLNGGYKCAVVYSMSHRPFASCVIEQPRSR